MEQRSPEWYAARRGLATASSFGAVLSGGRGAAAAAHRRRYMHRLAGERITGQSDRSFSNRHTERGRDQEPEAIAAYELRANVDVDPIGFVRNHGAGASPDGLVGPAGLVEIKAALAELLIPYLLGEAEPAEHRAQVQGQLWIAEREWCDLVIYCPGMPIYVQRYHRDEAYIEALAAAVRRFNAELESIVDTLGMYGKPGYDPARRMPDVTDLGDTSPPAF